MACFPDTLDKVMRSQGDTLKIAWSCGFKGVYPRGHALKAFGAHADPMLIRRKARCPVCGQTNPGRVWV